MKGWVAFQEIEFGFFALQNRFKAGQITLQQFSAAAQRLYLRDDQGVWWRMRAEDGAWLRWNGVAWDRATPPHLQNPQTMVDMSLSILKSLTRGLWWKLPLSALAALMVWAIHIALIIGPNGGLVAGNNALLDMILTLPGNLSAGIVFWAVLACLVATALVNLIRLGIWQILMRLTTVPAWVEYALSTSGGNVLISLLGGCATALLVGVLVGNRLVSFLMVLMALGAMVSQENSLLLRVFRLVWSDGFRLLNRPAIPFNPAWGGLVIIGAVFGFMGAVVLPRMPYTGCVGVFLLMGLVVFLVLLRRGDHLRGNAFLWLLPMAVASQTAPVGGEVTGSELLIAMVYSFLPAVGALMGVHLGLSLGLWEDQISSFRPEKVVPPPGEAERAPRSQPANWEAQPLKRSPGPVFSNETIILKGQPALDVLARIGMVRRIITPQGGRYYPLDLDPRGPVAAIAYFVDEQGYLTSKIAIAYSPPSTMPEQNESDREPVASLPPERGEQGLEASPEAPFGREAKEGFDEWRGGEIEQEGEPEP